MESSTVTIAVMSFDNESRDVSQEYFPRGFVEDLAIELSRFPTLGIIPPQSSGTNTPRSAYRLNVMMTRDVGLPLSRAIQTFGPERYAEAVRLIEPVRDIANRFGGSHAQRDVLTLTLIEAAIRSGQHRLAQHYIAERTVLRPGGKWGSRLLRRATA